VEGEVLRNRAFNWKLNNLRRRGKEGPRKKRRMLKRRDGGRPKFDSGKNKTEDTRGRASRW